ncbi:hypothetical protein FQN57_006914 [Myotisia sp. PD_48]|nr:hypothetical protein FQN57_006914 [Myotisia sp. PD_48]
MAAPVELTIQDLNGNWTMDTTISNDIEPVLILQGMSWLTRKALGMATITLHVNEYTEADTTHIDIAQTLTGGIPGTTEKRVLNWGINDHTDHIFGHVNGQTRFVKGKKAGDRLVPDLEIQTKVGIEEEDELVARFFQGEVLADGLPSDGWESTGPEGENTYLQSWVRSMDSGWTAEQVWGFEIIEGVRYYTRRVAVAKEGKCVRVRLVYEFLGRQN